MDDYSSANSGRPGIDEDITDAQLLDLLSLPEGN